MAPRRPRKVMSMHNTRMAAALDAMRPYGYEDDLVLKTVNELLDVYGEENWYFIEEGSYKVLLESILDQEEQQKKKELARDEAIYGSSSGSSALVGAGAEALNVALPTNEIVDPVSQKDDTSDTFFHPLKKKKELARDEAIYGSSSGSLALVCAEAEAEALNVALPTNEVVDPASQMDGISDTSLVIHKSDDNVDTLVPPSVEGGSSQDINLDKSSEKRLTASPHANESKQPADGFPIRRRRPYHGWISDGEDEPEPELVDFGTPTHSEKLQKVLFGRVVWKIRKTRWDLRPEDM